LVVRLIICLVVPVAVCFWFALPLIGRGLPLPFTVRTTVLAGMIPIDRGYRSTPVGFGSFTITTRRRAGYTGRIARRRERAPAAKPVDVPLFVSAKALVPGYHYSYPFPGCHLTPLPGPT